MRTVRNLSVLMLCVLTVRLAAQQQQQQQQQAGRWADPKCDLKPGHFLVNQGYMYLKSATTTKFEDQRKKDLNRPERKSPGPTLTFHRVLAAAHQLLAHYVTPFSVSFFSRCSDFTFKLQVLDTILFPQEEAKPEMILP